MTYENEVEVRRSSVGTKVLGVAVGVLGVLGSFWGVVWFIRSYVEAPRVNAPAPMILASRESIPVPTPAAPRTEIKVNLTADAAAPPATPAVLQTAAVAPQTSDTSPSNAIADRWFTGNQFGLPGIAPAPPPPAPVAAAPAVEAPPVAEETEKAADAEPGIEEVAESSVPAITGPAPLPRRKPLITAQVKRADATPLPRPRPDGQIAPQSVWTGVSSEDERFSARD